MPSKITPCLWFDGQAEEAAAFYTSIFKDSAITRTQYYKEAGKETHQHAAGSVLLIEFTIHGQTFTALNGGPQFKFNESVSFQIDCEDQAEVDYYWEKLGEDKDGGRGGESHCGWVKDRFGVSWQVIPKGLNEMISGKKEGEGDKVMEEKERRAWSALMGMGKIDIAAMKKEYDGEA